MLIVKGCWFHDSPFVTCQVASTDTVITREYTYSGSYGIHAVTVRAFTLANNDTASTSVDVLEWPCQAPNITIDPLLTDQNAPFIAIVDRGFAITAVFSVFCMKNERFNAQWEILDWSEQNVLATVANGSRLVSAGDALPAGQYVIRVTATLWSSYFDLSNKMVASYAYVTVERCQSPTLAASPLFASASDPYKTLVEVGFTVAMDYSFDCSLMEQFNARWDILDSTQQQTLRTLPNATELISLPNALSAGSYVIRINMTMSSSFVDLSDKVAVAYGYVNVSYCQPADVTLNPSAALDQPFSSSESAGFTVTADISVDCPPMQQLIAQWEILDSSLQSVVRSEPNATQLISSRFALPVGLYAVRVHTRLLSSFLDLSDKTVLSFTYINVTKCTVVAGIEGSSHITAEFNSTVQLSAYNHTFDVGLPPSDKSGMVFEWRCKRSNETWPKILPTQSYVPYSGTNGGCFGDVGPGVLGFAAGLLDLTINTGYLEPLVNYDIQFVVTKYVMSASADVTVFVQQPLAPVVSVRLVISAVR